jgi:UDP-N-acetylglucosamine/UDP-N-acetylgalactosamine 4-epimerase
LTCYAIVNFYPYMNKISRRTKITGILGTMEPSYSSEENANFYLDALESDKIADFATQNANFYQDALESDKIADFATQKNANFSPKFKNANVNFAGKIILLTGGAGFIGSHIAEALIKYDIERLIIIDNLSTGNLDNLISTGVFDDPRVCFYQDDVGDINVLRKILSEQSRVDIICHQAALGSVPRSMENPLASHKTNVDGFFNILVCAKDFGIKRFVYASSSSVYGDSQSLPKHEDGVGDVISPYAATKKINEIYGNVFSRCYGMECIGLRYFNVFGPRQNVNGPYAAVIPRFADAVRKGERPMIYGDGNQSRDFTYVENAVWANLLAMTAPSFSSRYNKCITGRVYNVASGGRVSLNEMYEDIKVITGTDMEPIYGNSRQGDIEHSWASISLAEKMLGYAPRVSFKEGLRRTMDYYFSASPQ